MMQGKINSYNVIQNLKIQGVRNSILYKTLNRLHTYLLQDS